MGSSFMGSSFMGSSFMGSSFMVHPLWVHPLWVHPLFQMFMGSSFLLYIDMVSLHSRSDLLKHTTKGFSLNHFLFQQLIFGKNMNSEFLLAALFLSFFSWLV